MCKCISIIQDDSGEKVNILGGHSIGHCEEKLYMKMCLIISIYQDSAVGISRSNSVRCLCKGLGGG
jgi:hypothetical protein